MKAETAARGVFAGLTMLSLAGGRDAQATGIPEENASDPNPHTLVLETGLEERDYFDGHAQFRAEAQEQGGAGIEDRFFTATIYLNSAETLTDLQNPDVSHLINLFRTEREEYALPVTLYSVQTEFGLLVSAATEPRDAVNLQTGENVRFVAVHDAETNQNATLFVPEGGRFGMVKVLDENGLPDLVPAILNEQTGEVMYLLQRTPAMPEGFYPGITDLEEIQIETNVERRIVEPPPGIAPTKEPYGSLTLVSGGADTLPPESLTVEIMNIESYRFLPGDEMRFRFERDANSQSFDLYFLDDLGKELRVPINNQGFHGHFLGMEVRQDALAREGESFYDSFGVVIDLANDVRTHLPNVVRDGYDFTLVSDRLTIVYPSADNQPVLATIVFPNECINADGNTVLRWNYDNILFSVRYPVNGTKIFEERPAQEVFDVLRQRRGQGATEVGVGFSYPFSSATIESYGNECLTSYHAQTVDSTHLNNQLKSDVGRPVNVGEVNGAAQITINN